MIVFAVDYVNQTVSIHHPGAALGGRGTGAPIIVATFLVAQPLEMVVVQNDFHGTGQRGQQRSRIGASLQKIVQLGIGQQVGLTLGGAW